MSEGQWRKRTARPDFIRGVVIFVVAYVLQLAMIPLESFRLDPMAIGLLHVGVLAVYGVSIFFFVRGLIVWVSGKR